MTKISKGGGPPKGNNPRGTGAKLKAGRRLKPSSQAWIRRQLSDPYVARSRAEGYRSRSAYKLIELDDRFGILKPGQRVVDLGAAPGGWSQVAAARTGSAPDDPRVVAIDYLEMDAVPGVVFLKRDFLDDGTDDAIRTALGGPADVVLSDMAAPTIGHRQTDHLRVVALVEAAADFAATVLAPGGAFLAKVFQGGTEGTLLAALKRDFATVRHVKPPASRKESPELYLLATGFRGGGASAEGGG